MQYLRYSRGDSEECLFWDVALYSLLGR